MDVKILAGRAQLSDVALVSRLEHTFTLRPVHSAFPVRPLTYAIG